MLQLLVEYACQPGFCLADLDTTEKLSAVFSFGSRFLQENNRVVSAVHARIVNASLKKKKKKKTTTYDTSYTESLMFTYLLLHTYLFIIALHWVDF